MSKLTAYLVGGQPVGTVVSGWSESDLNGNPAFLVEDVVSSGYQDISSIENWDNFGEIATDDCIIIRDEIKTLYDATTFASLSSNEKEVVSRWFVATKSERDSIKTLEEQEEDARILSECVAKSINNQLVDKIVDIDGGDIQNTYDETNNLILSVNGQTGSVTLGTDDVSEGSNLYYTTSRSRSSITGATGINYNSSTGVVQVDINDSSNATDELWSSNKIQSELDNLGNVEFFDAYDTSGGTNATGTWIQIPLNAERIEDSAFSHTNGSAEVTINETDTYIVMGRISTVVISNSRTQGEGRLELDTGSGFGEVVGTTGKMYCRQTNHGASCTFLTVMSLSVGDKLRMTFRRTNGSGTLQTTPDGSSLVIVKVRGQKGDKGDTGSGSNIIVQKDDSTVGTLTDELNFEGNVTVTDDGSNKTTVTIEGSVLGSEYYYAESELNSSTTSSTYQQKLRLSETLLGGTYRISWYCELTNSSTSSDTGLRIQINDGYIASEIEFEPEDANGYEGQSGFYVTTLSSGVNFIDMDFNENGNGTGNIRRARLEIMRIS